MRFGGGSGGSGPGEGGPGKKWEVVRVESQNFALFFPLPTLFFFFQFSEIFRGIEVVSARFLHNTHFGRSRRAED